MILLPAVEQSGRECIESALLRKARRGIEAQRIAVNAPAFFPERYLPEKGERVIVAPDNKRRLLVFGKSPKGFQPLFEFRVRLYVRIIEIAVNDEPPVSQGRQRVDGAGPAAYMQKYSIHVLGLSIVQALGSILKECILYNRGGEVNQISSLQAKAAPVLIQCLQDL